MLGVQRWFVYGWNKSRTIFINKIYDCRKFEFVENEISNKELLYKTCSVR